MKHLSDLNLPPVDQQAVLEAGRILRSALGAKQVMLFGSKACGRSHDDSDIDLLVLIPRRVRSEDRRAAIDALYETQLRLGVLFSPVLVNQDEWASELYLYSPLRQEVDRDGVLV